MLHRSQNLCCRLTGDTGVSAAVAPDYRAAARRRMLNLASDNPPKLFTLHKLFTSVSLFTLLLSDRRYRSIRCRTSSLRSSFSDTPPEIAFLMIHHFVILFI